MIMIDSCGTVHCLPAEVLIKNTEKQQQSIGCYVKKDEHTGR